MFGGWVSDELFKRAGSANIAPNSVESDTAVIAILSVAFFCQGMTGLGWTLISDIAPKNLMGLTGGVFNFAANLAGIVTPLVIGIIVAATGSFFTHSPMSAPSR
jgi:ACS family D-galactonate transporter-like MFS transporter